MGILLGGVAALGALLLLAWAFSRMRTEKAAQGLRMTLGVAGVIAGALLTVRGLAVVGVPLLGAALGLLGTAWRGGPKRARGAGAGTRRSRSAPMSRDDAREILGVSPDADAHAIKAAYRDKMKQAHPDVGGSDEEAARVKQARDLLLGED